MPLRTAVVLTSAALIVTKLLDCWTTARFLDVTLQQLRSGAAPC